MKSAILIRNFPYSNPLAQIMRKILGIILFLFTSELYACSCPDINPAIEFYESEYVFEGEIISKVYSKDSLTYKITFKINRHFKKGDSPKMLEFELKSEGEFTGVFTSCDWSAYLGQVWIVYANKYKEKLRFSGICSNSKPRDFENLGKYEQNVLKNGNLLDIKDYVWSHNRSFSWTKPKTKIDSILKLGKIKQYSKPYTWLKLYISEKGKLISVTTDRNIMLTRDSIFGFDKDVKIIQRKPLTDFEKDAIELIKKVENWGVMRYAKTQEPVRQLKHLTIEYDNSLKKWKYEL